MTQKEQIANALPGEERVRRKFDGKYYTLKFAEYSRKKAEHLAKIWRSNDTGNPHHVRIVHVPEGEGRVYEKYLLYMRPRPLTPAEKAEERRLKSGPNLMMRFFSPDVLPVTKHGRKAWKK